MKFLFRDTHYIWAVCSKFGYLITLFFLVLCSRSFGQKSACDSVYIIVEKMPVYGTEISDFYEDFGKNLKFSKKCPVEALTGVSWIIDKEGRMTDIEVRGLEGECATLIVDQLKGFPTWRPGERDGKKVCIRMTLPIHIRGGR